MYESRVVQSATSDRQNWIWRSRVRHLGWFAKQLVRSPSSRLGLGQH